MPYNDSEYGPLCHTKIVMHTLTYYCRSGFFGTPRSRWRATQPRTREPENQRGESIASRRPRTVSNPPLHIHGVVGHSELSTAHP